MDANTPITLAAARYSDRERAVADFDAVWDARGDGDFDHTAVAALTKDAEMEKEIAKARNNPSGS
jgi:hypothetical protein